MTEAEAANWFGTAFTAQQLWCCGMASTNAHCSDNADDVGISHDCNPLFADLRHLSTTHAQVGWVKSAFRRINDGIGFSVFQFGGAENPNNALSC